MRFTICPPIPGTWVCKTSLLQWAESITKGIKAPNRERFGEAKVVCGLINIIDLL
jgi:hypothetical protein